MQYERLDGDRIFVIRGFLTAEECGLLVTRSEQAGYHEATITMASGFVMAKEIRDNARLIEDDAVLAQELHVTVRPERGMALGFVHLQLHEGAPVVRGQKYVLRTDVMYALGTRIEDGLFR